MKLHADRLEGLNAISGYTPESVTINGTTWRGSVIVPHRGDVSAWACPAPAEMQPEHFEQIAALEPELMIFGSGPVLRFPPAAALRALMALRIGVESMDTRAACRTYNILAGEDRRVVAALWLPGAGSRPAQVLVHTENGAGGIRSGGTPKQWRAADL